MLTDQVAKQLSETVESLLKSNPNPDPRASWEIVFKSLFKCLKDNGVIEIKELETIQVASPSLVSPPTGGPVLGAITTPSTVSLKGKIT